MGNMASGSTSNYVFWSTTTNAISQGTSDMRLKENARPFEVDSLSFLEAVPLIHYDYIDGSDIDLIGWNGTVMNEIAPEMTTLTKDGFISVKDAFMPIHFHQAIKQLNNEKEDMKKEIYNLRKQVETLINKFK